MLYEGEYQNIHSLLNIIIQKMEIKNNSEIPMNPTISTEVYKTGRIKNVQQW